MTTRYTILLEYDADGHGYVVSVPTLPGCFSQGSTVPEAIERAREAIAGHILALAELGEPVPDEQVPPLTTFVEIDLLPLAGD